MVAMNRFVITRFFFVIIFCRFVVLHSSMESYTPFIYSCGAIDSNNLQTDLKTLLSNLNSEAKSSGFSTQSVNTGSQNQINGLMICYMDSLQENCLECLGVAVKNATILCPGSSTASFKYTECFLRYSKEEFIGRLTLDKPYIFYNNQSNITSSTMKNETEPELFGRLRQQAMNSSDFYARGNLTDPGMDQTVHDLDQMVYGIVQCTKDLNPDQCGLCLQNAIGNLTTYPSVPRGVRIFSANCYIRYELNALSVLSLPLPTPPGPTGSRTVRVIVIAISVFGAFLCISLACICFWRMRRAKQSEKYSEVNGTLSEEIIPRAELHVFDMKTLIAATNNFSKENLLGQGGFGPVYKGTLRNGEEIAVKKLKESSKQGAQEFEAEVRSLAALKHRNLVQLVGYYKDDQEQLLCYEYLPDGSLDDLLFGKDNDKSKALNWETRFKIAQGISCGLRYVHEESIYKIVHRDLKPANILLDKDMNPKISDFGTAKFFIDEVTHKFTRNPILTRGYAAPEYHQYGKFSFKSDVYSFGVILLNIVTGQKSIPPDRNTPFLIKIVIESWVKGNIEELIDPRMSEAPIEEIKRCIQIGLCCLYDNASRRPTMGEVDLMLQGYMDVPPISDEWLTSWMETFSSLSEID